MKKFKEWQAYSTDFYNRFLEVGLSVRFIYWILNLLSRRRFGNLIADYLFICSLAVAPFQSGTGFCSRFSAILYYTCSAVDAAQRTIPLHRRTVAGKRQRKILEKGRPDERHRSVGRTGFREMIASGWRTAPPQVVDLEVVLATNSACQLSLEASPRVADLPCVAPGKLSQSTPRAELFLHLAPVIEFRSRASASLILSALR